MPNPFDQFDAVPQANPFDKFDEATAPLQSSGLRRAVADPAISLARGIVGVPEALVGLADIPTMGGAGKAAEALGFRPREAKEFLGEFYSPEYKQTQKELQETQGFFPTIQKAIEKPSIIAHGLIESLPSIGAGGAIARGALAAAPRLGFAGAGAIGEGAVSAGATAEEVRQQSETGWITPGQSATAAISGAVTGGVTLAGAKIAQRFGLLDVEQILAGKAIGQATGKGAVRRVAEGFATEGAEELLQSAQEQIAQNIALGEELGMGVGQAAALGMLTGGLLGGGMQLARGQKPTAKGEPPAPEAPPVAEAPTGPAVPEPMGLSEFIRANREEGVTGPITATEVKTARPEYEVYKQAFINEQFGVQPLTPEQQRQIIINQTPLETQVAEAPVVAEPVQKTRIAEPVILGEQPAPAPAAPIITPQEAEFLRIAEKEAGYAAGQVEVQGGVQRQRGERAPSGQAAAASAGDKADPGIIRKRADSYYAAADEAFNSGDKARGVELAAKGDELTRRADDIESQAKQGRDTRLALLKRQRGELLTNREAKLVRDYEKAAPAVETTPVQTTPRFRGRQFGSAERRENFVNAYSSAVDTALADLTAQGVTATPNKLRRAATLLKRSAEDAVMAKDDAAGAAVLDAAMAKALRGIIPKAEIEVFRQKLADAAQAAMPETLSSRAAVDEVIAAKAANIRNTLAGMIGTPKDVLVETPERVAGGAGMIQFGELRDIIAVSLQASDAGSVAAHEGYHYLERRKLTGPERRVVRQAFASGSRLYRMLVAKAEAYDAANGTDITSEIRAIPAEARAYGFEFWRRGELEAQGMIAKVFQKLARVMERIRNYVDGLGFTSYEDLFAMIRRGEYAQRDLSGIREFEREVMRSRAQREASEQAFYSALAEAVADIRKVAGKDGMIVPAQAKAWLVARQKEGRFKAAELEAVGLAEWLDLQPDKVSVADIEAFVREHGVRVEETVLGEADERVAAGRAMAEAQGHAWEELSPTNQRRYIRAAGGESIAARPEDAPKFASYQLPGGENYRELLLRLPENAVRAPEVVVKRVGNWHPDLALDGKWAVTIDGESRGFVKAEDEHGARWQAAQMVRARLENEANFRSSHFDQPNILAHVRFNERTDADGKRVLFIEELQSDWAQKGRKEGFREAAPIRAEFAATDSGGGWWSVTRNGQPQGKFQADNAEAAISERMSQIATGSGVPSAPFVTDTKAWVALALKRMIRYAAENGFDRVAWTTGEQQADRYDLSKHVREIEVHPNSDSTYDLTLTMPDGATQQLRNIAENALEDNVGKDLAKKIIEDSARWVVANKEYRDALKKTDVPEAQLDALRAAREAVDLTYSGLDLKVGGEWTQAFYGGADQKVRGPSGRVLLDAHGKERIAIVPQVANEVLKKFGGGKVGIVNFPKTAQQARWDSEGAQYSAVAAQPGFDIAPALRSEAMAGLPLFSKAATESSAPQPIISLDEFAVDPAAFLRKPGWAVITGVQEAQGAYDSPANVEANARLEAELQALKLPYLKGSGKYLGVDQGDSFVVQMPEAEALRLARKYGQESVLTSDGYVYQDRSVTPVAHNQDVVGEAAKQRDGYTVVNGTAVSVGLLDMRLTPKDRADYSLPFAVHGVQGVHFSKEARPALSGHAFGTGLTGAERERLKTADPRIRVRTAFYVNLGQGVKPEAGVGNVPHMAVLNNLYDADVDAMGLFRTKSPNAAELALLQAGYAGYLSRKNVFGQQGVAVVFGRNDLPTVRLDDTNTEVPPPPQYSATQQAVREFVESKQLPAGQLTPAEWAAQAQRAMPETYPTLEDLGVFTGNGPVYRDELVKGAMQRQIDTMGAFYSRAATESITDITRRMNDGELQREQVNAHLMGQLDRPDMRDLTERLAEKAGFEMKALGASLKRLYHGYIGSGLNRARASQGYANVFGVMTHFIQRKAIIFERAIAKDLSTWVKGATKQDKTVVSKAMLEATVKGLARDSAEYHALMQPLTQEQRAMVDQAWAMIGKMLDAEFVAEQAKYRKLFADDAKFAEWFENRKVQVEQLKKNSYFPERRYGDHFVHAYVDAPDGKKITVYYEQYEREAGATSAKAELEKIFGAEGLKVEYGFKHKVDYDGSVSIGQFLDLAQRHGIALTQAEKERLGKALIAADSTRRNRLFRRQNVAGYSQDGMRVLAEFAVSMSNKIAYAEMGDALQDALQGRQVDVAFTKDGTVTINTQADTNLWQLDGPDAGFFRNLADEKVGFVMSPDSRSTISNKLRALAVIYFLGGSVAAAGVNLSSLPMITFPWLIQHTTPARAMSTLLEGMRLAGKHFNDIRDLPTLLSQKPLEGIDNVDGLRHALQIGAQDGSLFDTEQYQFMGLSRGQEYSLSGRTQEAVKLWMTPFRLAEQYNRVSAFIAAYKVAKSNNLDNEAAHKQAQEAVFGTQFRYDEANRPALADSGVGSLFFVFKSFPIFMMETMTFLAKTNPKSAVFMLGMLVLMAGVEGLPFAEDLEDLIDVLAQRLFNEPFNSKRWLRNTLKSASEAVVGADLSGVLMHGVANSLTGLNFASRVGAGNLIPGTRIGAADTDYRRAMDEILGPVGGMVTGIVGGADALSKGDFLEAAKKGLPLAAKNAVKGWEQFEKGYATDAGGRKLVDVGAWEAFWQSVGFSSSALSQVYESDQIDRRTVAFYNDIRTQFTKEMVSAIRDGDRAAAQEIGQAIMAWNQAHPDMPVAMSPAGLRRQVALAGMPLNQRTLLTMPKYLRGQSEAAIGLAAE